MSDDWKPGDIALCLKGDSWWVFSQNRAGKDAIKGPQRGEILTVQEVNVLSWLQGVYLNFERYRPHSKFAGWKSAYFVKITPEEADEFDKETIELYNKKPTKELT